MAFAVVGEREEEAVPGTDQPDKARAAEETSKAMQLMLALLGTFSKRVVIALGQCFTLLTVASAFALWFMSPHDPSPQQLISLGMYAVFILLVNFIARR